MSDSIRDIAAALDATELLPEGSLADRIRMLDHHRKEWKSLFCDTSNKLADKMEALELAGEYANDLEKALEDIALCRIPGVPDGVTVSVEQFAAFAREHAKEALKDREPTAKAHGTLATVAPSTYGNCETCGKPVCPPMNRYALTAIIAGGKVWHGECAPKAIGQ